VAVEGIPGYSPPCYHWLVKIGVSLNADLVAFANHEAAKRGTSRSGLLAELLEAERVRGQMRRYLDRHGWDVAEDEERWRTYQRERMAREYKDDAW
jgi:hypothetical protein